jgi:hypothetical protein
LLVGAYRVIREEYEADAQGLPNKTGGKDRKARRLDCLVLNRLMAILDARGRIKYQTRGGDR